MTRTRGRSLVRFFVLTYAVMWACFIPVAVAVPAETLLGTLLLFLGTFAPALVALGLTVRADGSAGVRRLVEPVLQWRVPAGLYLLAVGYIPAIKLTAALAHRLGTGMWPAFGTQPWYFIPMAIAFSTPFQAGEEIGWRGYALPRLAARFGLARASIVLGLLWAFWHLPQFFIAAADTFGQSFWVFVSQVTALSVAMAWLYARTGGSLLLVMLMHSAVNNAKDIVPSARPGSTNPFGLEASLVAWITVALLWICAACFLARMPRWSPPREGDLQAPADKPDST